MTRWFRSYSDKHRNPKVAQLSDSDFRLWDQLLCIATENGGLVPPVESLKRVLRMRQDHLARAIDRLIAAALFDAVDDGFAPRNWGERQFTGKPEKQAGYYTYLIGPEDLGEIKIGYSKNPWARLADLQTAHSKKLVIAAVIATSESGDRWLSDLFKDCSLAGEWFRPNDKMLALINELQSKRIKEQDDVVRYVANYVVETTTTETETETETEKNKDGGKPPASYAFFGRVIRLKPQDLDRWRIAFSGIPDIMGELYALDAWLDGQPEAKRKGWFHVTAGALNRKHQEMLASKKRDDGYDPDVITV